MNDIRKEYPGVVALDDVSFDLMEGEIHALLGSNGAGKSTLINVMSGAVVPEAGCITINGELIAFRSPLEALAAGIHVIHQEPALAPDLSVLDNIFLGREIRTRSGEIDRKAEKVAASEAFSKLDVEFDLDILVASLGFGQRQLVEIAKAILESPRVLILDEPTSALSESESTKLFSLLKSMVEQNVGVIYVSHRLDEIAPLCSRATVLRDGHSIGTFPTEELDRARLVSLISGNISMTEMSELAKQGERLLEIKGLSCVNIFDDVSFSVHRGETLVLTGLIGSGRTEILETIFGLREASSGVIGIDGRALKIATPSDAIAAGLALIPEDRPGQGVALNLSINDNITLPSLKRFLGYMGLSASKQKAHSVQKMSDLSIRAISEKDRTGSLSGGNQQKVVLAKCLTTNTQIFLFDEPTQGIDVGGKAEIYALIERLKQKGCAVLVVSSDLEEVLHIADRVLTLKNGSITGSFDRSTMSAEQIVAAITHGV
ncbi:sugar ABC transporter ATP-binding protein [Sneathiella chungangensis]|uniref:sugar ABC transporter ATP-binding protein n=1 Tax=Sneathiella chungangensis TaxID=1418234 RepID=UPI001371FBBA|nr:sugar ABC transporter ATP-binding protein [Sneathiella chungangensis]